MKRGSPLKRRKPLQARSQLRSRPQPVDRTDPNRIAWKTAHAGFCECGCDRFSLHLHRHHIVYEQHVRREGGDPWALVNSMLLHPDCHARHHSGFRRIPLPNVPEPAMDFAMRLLGFDRAALYMARFYAPELAEGQGRWRP